MRGTAREVTKPVAEERYWKPAATPLSLITIHRPPRLILVHFAWRGLALPIAGASRRALCTRSRLPVFRARHGICPLERGSITPHWPPSLPIHRAAGVALECDSLGRGARHAARSRKLGRRRGMRRSMCRLGAVPKRRAAQEDGLEWLLLPRRRPRRQARAVRRRRGSMMVQ